MKNILLILFAQLIDNILNVSFLALIGYTIKTSGNPWWIFMVLFLPYITPQKPINITDIPPVTETK